MLHVLQCRFLLYSVISYPEWTPKHSSTAAFYRLAPNNSIREALTCMGGILMGQTTGSDSTMAFERVTVDPNQMGGVPCLRGLRIPVATVVAMFADGMTDDEVLEALPHLEPEDIRQACTTRPSRCASESYPSSACSRFLLDDNLPPRSRGGAIASAAVYLASDETAFVHGTVIDVDGGQVGVAVIAAA